MYWKYAVPCLYQGPLQNVTIRSIYIKVTQSEEYLWSRQYRKTEHTKLLVILCKYHAHPGNVNVNSRLIVSIG
jgi:hypothetical protein